MTTGEVMKKLATISVYTIVYASSLSNAFTAATYLNSTYANYYRVKKSY